MNDYIVGDSYGNNVGTIVNVTLLSNFSRTGRMTMSARNSFTLAKTYTNAMPAHNMVAVEHKFALRSFYWHLARWQQNIFQPSMTQEFSPSSVVTISRSIVAHRSFSRIGRMISHFKKHASKGYPRVLTFLPEDKFDHEYTTFGIKFNPSRWGR